MPHLVDEPELLLKRIDQAFADWIYPGDAQVLRDQGCDELECEQLRQTVVGKHWKALKIGDVAYRDNLVLYLTPAGYRYYLPGLMKLSLENPEIYDLPAYIASALTPPTKDRQPRGTWLADYKNAFAVDQRRVIRDFLIWANARFEGQSAYDAVGVALSTIWDGIDDR